MTTISLLLDQNESREDVFRPGQILKGTVISVLNKLKIKILLLYLGTVVLSLSNARKFRGAVSLPSFKYLINCLLPIL